MADLPHWSHARLGCPERDAFVAQSRPRTALSEVLDGVTRTAHVDPTAAIEAQVSMVVSWQQYAAWRQFVRNDLAGGALPFITELWWFDHVVVVRARLIAPYTAQRMNAMTWTVSVHIEIERETIA